MTFGERNERPFRKAQAIASWFGMAALPRFSVNLGGHYALVIARQDDRIRLVIGTATPAGGRGGSHVALTLRQARYVRDELDRLLATVGQERRP